MKHQNLKILNGMNEKVMKLIRWIATLVYASIFIRILSYIAYKAYSGDNFTFADFIISWLGLFFLYACYLSVKISLNKKSNHI